MNRGIVAGGRVWGPWTAALCGQTRACGVAGHTEPVVVENR